MNLLQRLFSYLSAAGVPTVVSEATPLPVITTTVSPTTIVTTSEISKTVADAAVPEALVGVSTLRTSVGIRAKSTNTGSVRFGFQAADGTQVWNLVATEWIWLPVIPGKVYQLNSIYIDVDVNGEGVDAIGIL